MYHWIDDKEFLQNMRRLCSGIVNELVQAINKDSVINVSAHLVGSGARNMETQNSNEPVDLDYNLNILESHEFDINRDATKIKEYIKKMFNVVLKANNWSDCEDSTSALSTEKRHFTKGNQTKFKIDLAIVSESNNGSWFRLIHRKTGIVACDQWYWNEGPQSKGLTERVDWLKHNGCWLEVRDAYMEKKNRYLTGNDYNHPSFNCYVEAVNEVYNKY